MQVSMTSKIHFDLTNYKAFLLGQSNSSTSKSGKTVLSSFFWVQKYDKYRTSPNFCWQLT